MKIIAILTALTAIAFSSATQAEPRPEHFKGKPSPNLTVALVNLTESNAKLASLLKKDALSSEDMLEVHMLSYTIERALEKLGTEQARLALLMEEVHVASEHGDAKTIKTSGAAYLKGAAPLLR